MCIRKFGAVWRNLTHDLFDILILAGLGFCRASPLHPVALRGFKTNSRKKLLPKIPSEASPGIWGVPQKNYLSVRIAGGRPACIPVALRGFSE